MNVADERARRIGEALRLVYARVHATAMHDAPICNCALAVACVGFRPIGDFALGVVMTPWFMNLALAPLDPAEPPAAMRALAPGEARAVRLPSGEFDFLAGELRGFGPIWSCSIFSPMQDFPDQDTALATAEAVMNEVMRPPAPSVAAAPTTETSRRGLLRGLSGRAAASVTT